eukprot:TRINITY_DN3187_c0_g1_i1.p2 TRINITY_DN3187_c0_g1~~TRINITY_DN3187_c0_g1_i1.p2  ORF type:complete len:145 (-),score=41.31 TRINITY_DN3187_c0_g1_i1:404-838(-)
MAYQFQQLHNGLALEQALGSDNERLVVLRYGSSWDPACMQMDELLVQLYDRVRPHVCVFVMDASDAPDVAHGYGLSPTTEPFALLFFYQQRQLSLEVGSGVTTNRFAVPIRDPQELLALLEAAYRGAKQGRQLVVSPKDYTRQQ